MPKNGLWMDIIHYSAEMVFKLTVMPELTSYEPTNAIIAALLNLCTEIYSSLIRILLLGNNNK